MRSMERKTSTAPRRYSAPVTDRPIGPSHGVVRRPRARASTMAMGTPMLDTAWPTTKASALAALSPTAGR